MQGILENKMPVIRIGVLFFKMPPGILRGVVSDPPTTLKISLEVLAHKW
jgi:hypothetical protein